MFSISIWTTLLLLQEYQLKESGDDWIKEALKTVKPSSLISLKLTLILVLQLLHLDLSQMFC
jgi:hypothetical protein